MNELLTFKYRNSLQTAAYEVTTLWRYTNPFIFIIITMILWSLSYGSRTKKCFPLNHNSLIFTSQNDRVYVPVGTKKRFIQPSRLLGTLSTFSKSVMVSKMGVTELMFVDPGVKVNGQYYHDVLLSQQLIPAIKQVAGDTFVFQQDSAPAHRARDTIQPSSCCRERRLTSLFLTSGRPTVQT